MKQEQELQQEQEQEQEREHPTLNTNRNTNTLDPHSVQVQSGDSLTAWQKKDAVHAL